MRGWRLNEAPNYRGGTAQSQDAAAFTFIFIHPVVFIFIHPLVPHRSTLIQPLVVAFCHSIKDATRGRLFTRRPSFRLARARSG